MIKLLEIYLYVFFDILGPQFSLCLFDILFSENLYFTIKIHCKYWIQLKIIQVHKNYDGYYSFSQVLYHFFIYSSFLNGATNN